jgi:hypothetical protein
MVPCFRYTCLVCWRTCTSIQVSPTIQTTLSWLYISGSTSSTGLAILDTKTACVTVCYSSRIGGAHLTLIATIRKFLVGYSEVTNVGSVQQVRQHSAPPPPNTEIFLNNKNLFYWSSPAYWLSHDTQKTNSVALSPQANYTDRATATCRRNLVPTFHMTHTHCILCTGYYVMLKFTA